MPETTDDGPVRFTLPMGPDFRKTATKEQAVGAPIRWRSDEDVMLQGVVVDWKDEDDGSVTLTVEASAPDA
ncbi:hypothetical protein [Streptomyces europaeiscabiei]|uniref:hypothetical protein n=1 Tax=Streptomyces europaeiscabiei TaxID=146819 RepID=UPI002E25C6F8|nr:hypothetical protein OG858_48045 [Streptomyces europaeiscabiei]